MFGGCSRFNKSIASWDTGKVTDMNGMFYGCRYFDYPLPWNTGKVTDMKAMFADCTNFDQDLSNWNMEHVTDTQYMFENCRIRHNFRPKPNYTPIPISLKRRISMTYSNQGSQAVCGRHAFSRVIVKNFFELILPLRANGNQEKDCNIFLSTDPKYPTDLRTLTPQKCSFGGYMKILLFLHCFFLFQTHIQTVDGRPAGWLRVDQLSILYKYLYMSIEIPNITHDQLYDLQDALYTVQTVQTKYNISLVTFHFEDITLDNIKKITDRGLYIMLRITASTDEGEHSAHFVIIVGAFDEYMLIKNQWGEDTLYQIKFGHPFYLKDHRYNELTHCSFVIPVQQMHDEEFTDLTHVDSYLQKYDELKTKFDGIVVNVINNSCPSKNIDPVDCDALNSFRRQEDVFHPDNNPRCRDEAEIKFQRFITLKGCRHESPGQRLRLTGNGNLKTKKSRRGSCLQFV
jgi:surface protein